MASEMPQGNFEIKIVPTGYFMILYTKNSASKGKPHR